MLSTVSKERLPGRSFSGGRSVTLRILSSCPEGYNRLTAEQPSSGAVRLTYVGLPGANHALDHTFNLTPTADWTPQPTNPAPPDGRLILTSSPVSTTNNFWPMRQVP